MKKSTIICALLIGTSFVTIVAPSQSHAAEIPKANSSLLLTPENDKKAYEDTLCYLEKEHIEVETVLPEIGMITIKTANPHIIQNIEAHTAAEGEPQQTLYKPSETESVIKPFSPAQWNMKQILPNQADSIAWPKDTHIQIGVVDSGIDNTFKEKYADRFISAESFVPRGGYMNRDQDETGSSLDTQDRKGHGTSVTSLILGTDKMRGVAPEAKINSYRVFSKTGCQSDWVLKAVIKAIQNGDDIINLSLGSYGIITGSYGQSGQNNTQEFEAWKRIQRYAEEHGSILVVAAGNDGLNLDDSNQVLRKLNKKLPYYLKAQGKAVDLPASVPGVIQVASTAANGTRSNFSNYSTQSIYAPGGDQRLTNRYGLTQPVLEREWILVCNGSQNGQLRYGFNIGTSFSAPEISGLIAHLIVQSHLQKQPDKIHQLLKNVTTYNDHQFPMISLFDTIQPQSAAA